VDEVHRSVPLRRFPFILFYRVRANVVQIIAVAHKRKRPHRWLRTDEREDAVRSLEWAASFANDVESDPHVWKWQLVALHNAVQGFMVLALAKGNGLLALRPHIAEKWLRLIRLARLTRRFSFQRRSSMTS
jgi:hypothetical protein